MSIKSKIPLILFVALTLFSSSILGYTLYAILGVRLAMKSLQISIQDVTVDYQLSRITFKIVFRNAVNMHLSLKYVSVNIYLNNTKITYNPIQVGYENPIPLPFNVNTEIPLSGNIAKYYSNGELKFSLYVIFSTILIQQASVNRDIVYGG